MYEAGGGECGDGDLLRILKDEEERPSSGAIIRMCLHLDIKKDSQRTANTDDAWEYFYELLSQFADTMPREQLYESLASYLNPGEIEEHLTSINKQQRKTA